MPYADPEKRREVCAKTAKAWCLRNKEQAAINAREWRQRNKEAILVHSAKRRAKRDGVPFTLTVETCPIVPDICPVLGIPLQGRNDGKRGPVSGSPTLDRVDPSLGYTPENVRVISHRANRLKSDMSLEDLERLLLYMRGQL